jgi:hypothetical protein
MVAKATAKKPAAKKPTARKPAAKKPTAAATTKRAHKEAKAHPCGSPCHGVGHDTTPCELEAGHGGMHWHSGRKNQHVYITKDVGSVIVY